MAHLLVVDDNADLVDVFVTLLSSEGHTVHTASDGVEGLESLRSRPLPDIVVLDVEMPSLDGHGMAHQMRVHNAGEEKIPVVLVSARVDLREVAGIMGTPYFLTKPFGIVPFLNVIDRALREGIAPASA